MIEYNKEYELYELYCPECGESTTMKEAYICPYCKHDHSKDLRERWLTPEGKKVKQHIIEHIRDDNWEIFLAGFPFVEEVENGKDLRFFKISKTDLEGDELGGANFEGADLWGSHFKGVRLCDANFVEADLWNVIFTRTELEDANFEGASLWCVNFVETELLGPYFNEVAFTNVNFSDCTVNNARFNDCVINYIKFESSILIDIVWGNLLIKKRYFINLKPLERKDGSKGYIRLMETYISLKNQFNINGLYSDMSWAYLKEKESLRLHYKQNIAYKKINVRDRTKSFFKYIWEYILFFLFGYGEKPWHILGWSFLTIIIFGLIYKITNAIGSSLQDIDTGVTFLLSLLLIQLPYYLFILLMFITPNTT